MLCYALHSAALSQIQPDRHDLLQDMLKPCRQQTCLKPISNQRIVEMVSGNAKACAHQVTYPVRLQDLVHLRSLVLSIHGPERVDGTSSSKHDACTTTRMLIYLTGHTVICAREHCGVAKQESYRQSQIV